MRSGSLRLLKRRNYVNNKREAASKEKDFLFLRASVFLSALLILLGASLGAYAQRNAIYTNPVMAGDYPDPSVIRVGKDYYATATSSEWGPEFPILHSRDLVNWEIVGTVFPKRPAWSVGNYWAPEIWQDKGKFYIFYVARKQGASLCIAVATAAKPTGPYTDHGALACQEVGSIDAFPIRDENGKLFQRSAVCTHLGCIVRFNSLEKTWDCPCHGSRFGIDGHPINTPAIKPLGEVEASSNE